MTPRTTLLRSYVAFLALGFLSLGLVGMPTYPSGDAEILLTRDGSSVQITGMYTNSAEQPGPLTYELDVTRTGSQGSTKSTQSGAFETAPNQRDTLSTSSVNVQDGDTLRIHLQVRYNAATIDEDSVHCTVPNCPFTDPSD